MTEARKTLDLLDSLIPPERVHYDSQIMPLTAQLARRIGYEAKAKKFEKYALVDLQRTYDEVASAPKLSPRDMQASLLYVQGLILKNMTRPTPSI